MKNRTIRASELGTFLFCKRAWWYRLQGKPSQNQPQMTAGTEFHQAHGQRVAQAVVMNAGGWVLLLIALLLLTIGIVQLLVG